MENQLSEVRHIHVGQQYTVSFEQGAVKGIIGYKVEANGDNPMTVMAEALALLALAKKEAPALEVTAK